MFSVHEQISITIQSRFIFNKVMQNEQICKMLLSEILNIQIEKIIYQEEEKNIENAIDSRGIRCDVYIKDDKHTVYNIEMQAATEKSLSKRSRYYQSMIDSDLLERGEEYSELTKRYIIFICCFDYFGKNLYRYTFENIGIEDNEIKLNDGTTRIFLNAKGFRGEASEATKNFLKYVDGQFTEDSFSAILKAESKQIKAESEQIKAATIQKFIIGCKQLDASKEKVSELLQQHFDFSQDMAVKYIENYWSDK